MTARSKEADQERIYKGKLTNREDVVRILDVYLRKNILPFAVRLDAAEAALRYLVAPWYMRRWWDCKRVWDALIEWLAARGIRSGCISIPRSARWSLRLTRKVRSKRSTAPNPGCL